MYPPEYISHVCPEGDRTAESKSITAARPAKMIRINLTCRMRASFTPESIVISPIFFRTFCQVNGTNFPAAASSLVNPDGSIRFQQEPILKDPNPNDPVAQSLLA
jgi:hypothetical protein